MICPMCNGAQSFAGERRRVGRHGLYVEEIDCEECNGTGKVEDDYHERREECRRIDEQMADMDQYNNLRDLGKSHNEACEMLEQE